MRRSSYGERDYAFGQLILSLRSAIGLTQAGLSDHLGISPRAVGEWEAGSSYPKATHLKAFIALAVKQQVFPVGHEEEEIRALWKAAHQKVLLDETWLSELLSEPPAPSAQVVVEQNGGAQVGSTPTPSQTSLALVSPPGRMMAKRSKACVLWASERAVSGITDAVMMHLFHKLKPTTPSSLSIPDHQRNCKVFTNLIPKFTPAVVNWLRSLPSLFGICDGPHLEGLASHLDRGLRMGHQMMIPIRIG